MIAIKNFEKPNACYQCELLDEHGVCSITGNDNFNDCPLIEIEQSDDCVSRKFMYELGATCIATRDKNDKLIALGTIENLPSVIPTQS